MGRTEPLPRGETGTARPSSATVTVRAALRHSEWFRGGHGLGVDGQCGEQSFDEWTNRRAYGDPRGETISGEFDVSATRCGAQHGGPYRRQGFAAGRCPCARPRRVNACDLSGRGADTPQCRRHDDDECRECHRYLDGDGAALVAEGFRRPGGLW
jgi:hypothetical protein